jgi:formylglycine-generating enzyme required for sulfatase activity
MPNQFGLFDALGNVYEWCHDFSVTAATTVPGRVVEDTETSQISASPVVRGGSFVDAPKALRCAYRPYQPPWSRNQLIGFRIARTVKPQEPEPVAQAN